jgi:hypothetical protein
MACDNEISVIETTLDENTIIAFEDENTVVIETPAAQGPMGLSAYSIALDNGFVGTVEEWLESLKAPTAYQIALDNGYVGTFEQWARDVSTQVILESDAFKILSNDGINTFWAELTLETLGVVTLIRQEIEDAGMVKEVELTGKVEDIVNNMTLDVGDI